MDNYLHFINIERAIQEVYAFQTEGLPFINRFACELFVPGLDLTGIPFQVLSADVPTFAFSSNDTELFGQNRFNFKSREDGDLGITFMETPSLRMRLAFYQWMNDFLQVNNNGTVTRSYPDSQANMIIYPIDSFGNSKIVDRFIGVVPYEISGIPYTYSDTELIKTTVKFKYKYHHLTTHKSSSPNI
jgi:hypothetical protein